MSVKENRRSLYFKKAWRWPDKVETYFKGVIEHPSCHVFCGVSKLGDVRIDILGPEKTEATHKADILEGLPFPNDHFQSVFGDPPWHIAKHLRSKIMYELRRICRPRGKIILNANWGPNNLRGCVLLQPIYISVGRMPFGNSAMIMTWLKLLQEDQILKEIKAEKETKK